jgi:hypothetical protein
MGYFTSQWCSLSLKVVRSIGLVAVMVAVSVFSLAERVDAQDSEGDFSSTQSSQVSIHVWDPIRDRWVDCAATPDYVGCQFHGVVFPTVAGVPIPVGVGVGLSCSQDEVVFSGSAFMLPVLCSRISPCVINGVKLECSAGNGQVTCTLSIPEGQYWRVITTHTYNVGDSFELVRSCLNDLYLRGAEFVANHVDVFPQPDFPQPTFPVGNPSDPQPGNDIRINFLEIRW